MTPREQFIAWLNDAYSTELALIPVLENHAEDAREYPEIYNRDMQHAEETRHQAERLERMITSLGGRVSTVKSVIGKLFGAGQSISTEFFQDELTKNFLSDYAAEHFEIASYKALIATAEQIGEHQCIPILEEILREEQAMARWIEERLPFAVRVGLEKTTSSNYETGRGSQKTYRKTRRQGYNGRTQRSSLITPLLIGGGIGAAAILLTQQNKKTKTRSFREESNPALIDDHTTGLTTSRVMVSTEETRNQMAKASGSSGL